MPRSSRRNSLSLSARLLAALLAVAACAASANQYDLELVVFLNTAGRSTEVDRPDAEHDPELERILQARLERTGSVTALPEGCGDYTAGKNDFGNTGYGGPMPPEGHGEHKYYFWVLALDKELDLPDGLTLWELLEKIEPHVTGMNRLVGTYRRS